MGIPRELEGFIFERTNTILGFTDPEYVQSDDPTVIIGALLTASPDRLRSAFINGIKHLPVEWTPTRGS